MWPTSQNFLYFMLVPLYLYNTSARLFGTSITIFKAELETHNFKMFVN